MVDTDNIAEQIADAIAAPSSVSADGVSVSAHPLPGQLDALRQLERRQAVRRSPFGQIVQIVSPDANGER